MAEAAAPVAEVAVEPVAEVAAEPMPEAVVEPAAEVAVEPMAEALAEAPAEVALIEDEPVETGPLFELVAPEPVDVAAETAPDLAEEADKYTADLLALIGTEPEPEPEPEFEVAEAVAEAPVPVAAVAVPEPEPEVEHVIAAVEPAPPAEASAEAKAARGRITWTQSLDDGFAAPADLVGVPMPEAGESVGAMMAAIVPIATRKADAAKVSVARLEKFLRQVEARRAQLRSETVA